MNPRRLLISSVSAASAVALSCLVVWAIFGDPWKGLLGGFFAITWLYHYRVVWAPEPVR